MRAPASTKTPAPAGVFVRALRRRQAGEDAALTTQTRAKTTQPTMQSSTTTRTTTTRTTTMTYVDSMSSRYV
jgi:hypothetical protein